MKLILIGAAGVAAWYAYKIYTTVKNIKVSFSGIYGIKADKSGLRVKTSLEFDNIAGKQGFTVERVLLRLYIDGRQVAEITDHDAIRVEAYSTANMDYDIAVSWKDMGVTVLNFLKNLSDDVKVELKGVVYVAGAAVTIGKTPIATVNLKKEIANFTEAIDKVIDGAGDVWEDVTSIWKNFKTRKAERQSEDTVAVTGFYNIQ